MPKDILNVCCAVIADGGRVLAVQRGPESSHAWQWEFPGGKIQEDETAQACIIREIQEELSVTVTVDTPLEAVEFDYGFRKVRLIPFVCRIVSGTLFLTEHVGLKWLRMDELDTMIWSGADRVLIQKNREGLVKLMQKTL
jgi:8-oxo-dGTP diphosphatase